MPALVENNYIYIAQPPLYRVSRKKKSKYIHSEKEMDGYLLHLGMSDLKFYLNDQPEPLNSKEMETLLDTVLEVESFILKLEKKGIGFREFLSLKNEQGHYPRFLVDLTTGTKFVYNEDEFAELKQADEGAQRMRFEETLASIPEAEQTEEMKVFKPKSLPFVELSEEQGMQTLMEKLGLYSFTLEQYLIAKGKLLDIEEEGEKRTTMYTLREVIGFLRVNGRKGIEIQRYKGLGEMNADQLWETTMDPEKRTLLRVTVPDMVAADHMFTMLMGEEVPPRRAFIEQYALSIKNLDI